MKLKIGILALMAAVSVWEVPSAHAVVFPDQPAANPLNQDENEDSVSRFGMNSRSNHSEEGVPRIMEPIANSSFESSPGRAPASFGGRDPAGVKAKPSRIEASDSKSGRSAVLRKANDKKAYQEVAVIANELGFFPNTLFITQGIAVRLYITGASAKSQCFMLDEYGIRRQVRSQKVEEVTFTPEQSGTFTFHCPMNGAKGTVVVKELEIPERAPASFSLSTASSVPIPAEKPKSEIEDDDFTPEFRKP